MSPIDIWAAKWHVLPAAIAELQSVLSSIDVVDGFGTGAGDRDDGNETEISKQIRIEASRVGALLFRNNSGVGFNPAGRPVRFGLGNDSKRLNAVLKSSDLIGLAPGGRFLAVECKRPGWSWRGTERETAQRNFHSFIGANGGLGLFATCWADVRRILFG